ncbi:hypothetical protein [Sphingomonas sp. BK069]|uniref:hypothetical protein n=1 Tax=Sphingomonas sp. BK069 TaxID=2586979 RepID=UPI00161CC51D|nr:hypothetical protein [Sphingomonas sp. BK069]MBB3348306.1 hypothetical protein [Sphingomonas sp. BK069]
MTEENSGRSEAQSQENALDEALEESFPASDPVAIDPPGRMGVGDSSLSGNYG